jgi:hypothetical protein
LEGAGTGDNFYAASNDLQQGDVAAPRSYHDLANEWDKLVQQIRGLKEFDRFLLPLTFSQLRIAACNGPVICINVSQCHCDALILRPDLDGILHVPLKNFTYQAAEVMYRCLKLLLGRKDRNILHDTGSGSRAAQNNIHLNRQSTEVMIEHLFRASAPANEVREIEFVYSSNDPETTFGNILAQLWGAVVKPILDALVFSVRPVTL